jgi:hypothetical protein
MTYRDINFENTVFIVDGLITAFIVSILAQDNKINCIIEIKEGFEDSLKIIKVLLSDAKLESCKEYHVLPRYYLLQKDKPFESIKNLFMLKKNLSKVDYDENKFYAGATTSSIFSMIYPEGRKIYIDHGTGDYYRRMLRSDKVAAAKRMFYLFCKMTGLPNMVFFESRIGFTLCKMIGDNFHHVDFVDFKSTKIQMHLEALIQETNKRKDNTLVLAVSSWHTKDGIDGNTVTYDDINLEMIKRNVGPNEKIFVKYHPSLKYSNNKKIELIGKLRRQGYDATNIDDYLSGDISLSLPAEVLIKYCNFSKVITEESSLIWNIAHNSKCKLISEAKLFEQYFAEKRSLEHVVKLNDVIVNNTYHSWN